MINEEQLEQLTEILVKNVEKANIIFLENIGEIIKKIGELRPTEAHILINMLQYGGNFTKIELEIARLLNTNIETIDKIFSEYAKKDQQFYKQFYQYRNIPFTPYKQNNALKRHVQALANITKNQMMKYSRTNAIGYSIKDLSGNPRFLGLRETYDRVLDEAFLNVGQGKETFDSAMRNVMKQLGGSGLKTVDYESDRSVRLDSTVRMHLMNNLTELHNENQRLFGEEFGANMVEVSHHQNSAPDHIDSIDGKQFARINILKEQIKNGEEPNIKMSDIKGNKVKVNGKWYYDFDYINDNLERKVGQYNCRHYTFEGVLGVSKPNYSEEELKKDKEKNEKGCIIDDKHYTLYEIEQLMRTYERNVRSYKDINILAKSADDTELIDSSQNKIDKLMNKYKDICKISGLRPQYDRLRV